jgi:hypothetical protein
LRLIEASGCIMTAGAFVTAALSPVAMAQGAAIARFSQAQPGAGIPREWRPMKLSHWKAPEHALVADEGITVLRSRVEAAAGSLVHDLDADPRERPILAWRWKVDRVLDKGDLTRKAGDDFAARVYVYFDMPADALPFTERAKLKIARLYSGLDLPAATICYVWDNRNPVGTSAWSAYTDRVRVVVLESGGAKAGRWAEETRDLDADFRAAFGSSWKKDTPRVIGIAIGNDTDQTKESVTAWFGDFRLEARR